MKLCLIAPVPPPFGGVANWEQIVVNEIRKNDDICLNIINIAVNKRPTDGRNIFDRVFYGSYVMLRAYFQLKKIVKNDPPDVVHMTTSGGLGFWRDLLLLGYLKRKKIPSVYHIHFGRAAKYKEKNKRCWKQLKKAISIANTTITIDKKSYEILKPFANKIENINNPINLIEYTKYEKTDTNKIMYIGWIIKEKGIEELLKAFSRFNEKQENKFILELIGPSNGEYLQKLKKIYATPYVNIRGEFPHEDAMKQLSQASVFILPSYTEGFPNVILEAMALEKCIIATKVGAIPEILENGIGILIEPKSVVAIIDALNYVFEDKVRRKEYGEKAYVKACQYDIKETYLKYKKIWEKYI